MKVTIERRDGLAVVRPEGRLDFEASPAFQQQIEQAIAEAADATEPMIVDCAALDYVSSAGLRVFLVAARAAKAAGIGFAACALQPGVQEVFGVTGFDRIIDVHADMAAASEKAAAAKK